MFIDLLKIIEFVKGAVGGVLKLKTDSERKAASLEMLKTYFLILDAHEDGVRLLDSVTNDPVDYIRSLTDTELQAQLKVWDLILRRQSRRLYEAQSYISSQSYLAVVDPDAQHGISQVIGYKMDRLVTLHGLGAGLFFRTVFPIEEPPEVMAALVVQVLTKQKGGVIDPEAVRDELARLKDGLGQFRAVIMTLIDKEGFHSLASEAREATLFGGRGT